MAGSEPKRNGDVFDLKKLQELVELMKEHDLHELVLKQDKQHLRLVRGGQLITPTFVSSTASPAATSVNSPPVTQAAMPPSAAPESSSIATIDSPMVGTFYSKPNPDTENFVSVGDVIGPDTVVCIIEAMKVFNEITADVAGRVVAILANNEDAVEFGRPLFKVDTSK